MKTKVSSITLLAGILLILVPDISSAQGNYNPQAAVNYAEQWWNGRNSIDPGECDPYRDYGKYDCANFVSQCLHDVNGGGLDLNAPDYSCGCFSTCTLLHDYLIKYPGIQWLPTLKGDPIPDFFKAGDPAMFGYTEPNGVVHQRSHAVFAVAGEGDYAICNAHSPNDSNTIQEFYEKYPSFDRCTYYHIPRVFSGAGSGTESDPYIITTVSELQEINDDLDAWYDLGNDIDASDTKNWNGGAGLIPIGNHDDWPSKAFRGYFDGKGHTISGLYINRPNTGYVGLFGAAYNCDIKNVGLIGVDVTGRDHVGGLIGRASYAASFPSRCYTTGMVSGNDLVGGLIGYNQGNDITDCYSTASVNGNSYVGGLAGANSGVSSINWSDVTHCYSAGLVNGTGDFVGGLVGAGHSTHWNSCYWDIESSGQNTSDGGLGKTTMEMKWHVTYTFTANTWNFKTVWNIQEDVTYPFLRICADDPQAPPPSQIAGSGTEEDPYIITSAKELQAMNNHLTAWYELGNEINTYATSGWNGGAGFIPIGNHDDWPNNVFRGYFDGKGHTISGLYINRPNTGYVGLFGAAYNCDIKNVGLIGVDVTGKDHVGGLIGRSSYATSSPVRCYTTGRVSGHDLVGGLIGYSQRNDITDCYSTASVHGKSYVGGLAGANSGSTYNWSVATNCYSAGLVNGNGDFVGGLVGAGHNTHWNSCYWDIETSAQDTSDGGLEKTTIEMKQKTTFTNWDFETVWDIVEGQRYPFLRGVGGQEPPEEPPAIEQFNVCSADISCLVNLAAAIPYYGIPADIAKYAVAACDIMQLQDEGYEKRALAKELLLTINLIFDFLEVVPEPTDLVIGAITCMEGKMWETLEPCGGYKWSCIKERWPELLAEFLMFPGPILSIITRSPVDIRIIDTQGNVMELNTEGYTDNGLSSPGWIFKGPNNQELAIILEADDEYLFEVVGTEGGTYGLDIASVSGGEEITFEAIDIPTSPGAKHVYAVDWGALSAGEEGVILEIDKNGDGFFEQMAIADNELSYDEFALQTETVVDFDPDTLNLKSKGKFVTVYIELPEDFDVSEIDLFSLELNELVHPLPKPIEIGDYDSDGTNDLMVKFDLQELIEVLEPGEQIIDLTGRLLDGRPLAGFDFIRVIH